jgi:hypothetical protein
VLRRLLRKFLYQLWSIFLAVGKVLLKVVLIGPLLCYAWRRRRRRRRGWDTESDPESFYLGDRLGEVSSASSSSSLDRRFSDEDNSWDQRAVRRFIRVPLRVRGRRRQTIIFEDEDV